MRTFVVAAGALALSASAALAQPISQYRGDGYAAPVAGEAYAEPAYASPSDGTNYQFQDGGGSTAPGFAAQNATEASDTTPNMGAGTTRSGNANNG